VEGRPRDWSGPERPTQLVNQKREPSLRGGSSRVILHARPARTDRAVGNAAWGR